MSSNIEEEIENTVESITNIEENNEPKEPMEKVLDEDGFSELRSVASEKYNNAT